MEHKLVNISDVANVPAPTNLTPEEESAVISKYKAERTKAALDADYQDFDKQVAEGVPAEQLLQELADESSAE